MATPRSVIAAQGGDPMSSPQMANLLNKTAAAAEEFKRLLAAEQSWIEERSTLMKNLQTKAQELDKLQAKCRRLEELRATEVAAWRKERDAVLKEKEATSARITGLMRELDVKAQAEARFDLERKSWAERVERIEKIASDAKEDAKSAGEEVTRLQRAYQDLFSKSRQEKENLVKQSQVIQEDNSDMRQKERALKEQNKASASQIESLDKAVNDYRRTIEQQRQEQDELHQQIDSMEHEIGDVMHQLNTAQQALEVEKEAHVTALEFERAERQRQQEFFGQALAEAEAEARTTASQVHALKLKVVQFERESKRLKEERNSLQHKIQYLEEDRTRERSEWEETYQQLTETIATKEMEQDAAAAHLEVMLRSVGGAVEDSPAPAPSNTLRERSRTAGKPSERDTYGLPSERDTYRPNERDIRKSTQPEAPYVSASRQASTQPRDRSPPRETGVRLPQPRDRSPPSRQASMQPIDRSPHDNSRSMPRDRSPIDARNHSSFASPIELASRTPQIIEPQVRRRSDADEYPREAPPRPLEHEMSHANHSPESHSQREDQSGRSEQRLSLDTRPKSRRASTAGDSDSKSIPHFMQPKNIRDTGTTAGEVANFWNVGLRANFHGVRDPVKDAMSESEDKRLIRPGRTPNRPDNSRRSGSAGRREWH